MEGRKFRANVLRNSLEMFASAWRRVERRSMVHEGFDINRRRELKKLSRPSWLSQLMRDQLLRILGRETAKRGWWKSWEEGGR